MEMVTALVVMAAAVGDNINDITAGRYIANIIWKPISLGHLRLEYCCR